MVDNPAFSRSIGGAIGAGSITANSIGTGSGAPTSLTPPQPVISWGRDARNVPDPNTGSTSQRGATAARFPALQGRPVQGELGARKRAGTQGQW